MAIQTRLPRTLRPHPKAVEIFGDPKASTEYSAILKSIRENGMYEKPVINQDGVLLAGLLRFECWVELHGPDRPIEVDVRQFASPEAELMFLIEHNTQRRSWSKRQKAAALHALCSTPAEQGGALQPRGRPKKGSASGTFSDPQKTVAVAADALGIGKHEARDLGVIFETPGVPEELQTAVDNGSLSPTAAARAIKASLKDQQGAISDPTEVLRRVNPDVPPVESSLAGLDAQLKELNTNLLAEVRGEPASEETARRARNLLADVLGQVSTEFALALVARGLGAYAPVVRRTKKGWLILATPSGTLKS